MEHDIEKWERELREAGWRQYRYRGHNYKMMWVSPKGQIYRGPYDAWRMMKSLEQWGEHTAFNCEVCGSDRCKLPEVVKA